MTSVGFPHAGVRMSTTWEERSALSPREGAVPPEALSDGMPAFYRRTLDLEQRRALDAFLRPRQGERFLDVGCGEGRWSLVLGSRGASVVGVDRSPARVRKARRRAAEDGLGARCRFEVADLPSLDLGERFDSILVVNVLEGIQEPERLFEAVLRLRSHLLPQGRLILLEAAPSRPESDPVEGRGFESYLQLFRDTSLRLVGLRGVDPARFRNLLAPYCLKLPRPLAAVSLAALTALSLPVDLLLGRLLTGASWHKVFVLTRDDEDPCAPS